LAARHHTTQRLKDAIDRLPKRPGMKIHYALAMLCVLTACSSHKATVVTSNGVETVTSTGTDADKKVTIQSKDSTMTFGQGAIDESKLGVPIYPGATNKSDGGYDVSSSKGSQQAASFETPDGFEAVYNFYKSHLPAGSQQIKMDEGESEIATFQIGTTTSPTTISVQIAGKKAGDTAIAIIRQSH
jgi:hypothetical protein